MRDIRHHRAQMPGKNGILRLEEVMPNPLGNIQRLFLLQGNPVEAPISCIEQADLIPQVSGCGRLQIFHFNDLHNHLTELSGPTMGTQRFSQMVKRVGNAKLEMGNQDAILFLSVGDDHTGSMLDELIGWSDERFVLDASYRAYSDGGVDATVLGNHEFDRGSQLLAKGIRQDAQLAILSANVHSSQHLKAGEDYCPGAIAVVGNLRVGLIGLTTHVETRVGQASDPTLAVASPLVIINNILPAFAPLVDVVLILSHCGFGDGAHKSGKAAAIRDIGEADFSIAKAASIITRKPLLILGGHTHTILNEHGLEEANISSGIPIFQAGCNGRYLGEIDINIDPSHDQGIQFANVGLHPIKPYEKNCDNNHEQSALSEQCYDYDLEFEEQTIAPILDKVQIALNTPIATINTDCLSFKSAVLTRYAQECALANFVCDTIYTRMRNLGYEADFAVMNGATIQSGIERGELNAGEWFEVLPYADEIFLVRLSGQQLGQLLQSNAKRVLRPDEFAHTDHTGFLARGFFHTSSQIHYSLDLGADAADAQAIDIEYCGRPLISMQNRKFTVVMSTYLALGGFGERWNGLPICGGVPGNLAGYDLRDLSAENTGLVYRDEVAAQIREIDTICDANTGERDGRLKIIDRKQGANNHDSQ
jgi:5'-nucleotidase/UDP-sugar diphosphatase